MLRPPPRLSRPGRLPVRAGQSADLPPHTPPRPAGCLPSLATIPIFIGLFRSLSDFASQEEAGSAAFYWIPSLAGPTSVAAQQAGEARPPLLGRARCVEDELLTRCAGLPWDSTAAGLPCSPCPATSLPHAGQPATS